MTTYSINDLLKFITLYFGGNIKIALNIVSDLNKMEGKIKNAKIKQFNKIEILDYLNYKISNPKHIANIISNFKN